MTNYAQNNFKDSTIAQEGGGNKALIILTAIVFVGVCIAFKHAIGG